MFIGDDLPSKTWKNWLHDWLTQKPGDLMLGNPWPDGLRGQNHNGQCDIPDLDYQAVSGQCAIVAVGDNDGQHNIPPSVE